MIARGILWGGFHNMSYAHTVDDIDYTLDAYREVLVLLHEAVISGTLADMLRGKPVEPVFRRIGNFNTKPRMARATV
jgi:glutamate-1-semialdehyde 2,1-aminomutase/spore coat polysaccharide biosynthesis protein SpsF